VAVATRKVLLYMRSLLPGKCCLGSFSVSAGWPFPMVAPIFLLLGRGTFRVGLRGQRLIFGEVHTGPDNAAL